MFKRSAQFLCAGVVTIEIWINDVSTECSISMHRRGDNRDLDTLCLNGVLNFYAQAW